MLITNFVSYYNTHYMRKALLILMVLFPMLAGATRLLVSPLRDGYDINDVAKDKNSGIYFRLEEGEASVYFHSITPQEDERLLWSLENYVVPDTIYSEDGREWIVTRLENLAFHDCHVLKSVTLPQTLRQIDDGAFYDCWALEELHIPAGVNKIIPPISVGNQGLKILSVAEDNEVYYSESNCIFEKSSGKLIQGCSASVIPDYVTTIGPYAFSSVSMGEGEHLSIPESVVCIEDWAFAGFATSTGFEFPSHIQELGFGIFIGAALNENDGVADITVPEGVTKLLGTFFDALPMHSYTLPSTLAEIDAYTFVEAEPRPTSNEDYYSGEYKKRAYQRYMVCYAATPPAVVPSDDKSKVEMYYSSLEEDDILNSDDYRVGRFLLVPRESIELYKTAPYWKKFPMIAAVEDGVEAAEAKYTLGIEQVRQLKDTGKIYDLNGMRIARPRKGIYIQNGKKVVVK